jgi:uncharacterized protein DUF1206
VATGTGHSNAGQTAHSNAGQTAKSAGHRAANSRALRWLARAGFAARGVTYILVGWIAIQAAFGNSSQQADKSGALQEIGSTPVGGVLLWLLFIGFIGMALWQLSIVAFGMSEASDHSDHETRTRLAALGRVVVYAVIAWSVLKFAVGQGTQSSDKESVDLTATLLKYPFGQVLVVIIGLALVGGGVYLAYAAWKEKFRKRLELSQAGRLRRVVEWLGKFGGMARGAVFVTAGVFLVVAAVQHNPQQAKGVDSSLRTLASTPLGPWLLVLVAIGLIMFGLFSFCQAKWQRL